MISTCETHRFLNLRVLRSFLRHPPPPAWRGQTEEPADERGEDEGFYAGDAVRMETAGGHDDRRKDD
jgi:hypothetical protein